MEENTRTMVSPKEQYDTILKETEKTASFITVRSPILVIDEPSAMTVRGWFSHVWNSISRNSSLWHIGDIFFIGIAKDFAVTTRNPWRFWQDANYIFQLNDYQQIGPMYDTDAGRTVTALSVHLSIKAFDTFLEANAIAPEQANIYFSFDEIKGKKSVFVEMHIPLEHVLSFQIKRK